MKQFSGKFVLRLPFSLHENLVRESKKKGLSLNQYCLEALENRLRKVGEEDITPLPERDKVVKKLTEKFSQLLFGIVAFGSRVTGEATETSDLDLLIVLDPSIPLSRDLYRWWDDQEFENTYPINPHFVSYPFQVEEVGSLWLEAATTGKVIFDRKNKTLSFLKKILKMIEQGSVRRYWAHGHPYWAWNTHEKQIPR